jgi:RNA polymerase sigma-70 factor
MTDLFLPAHGTSKADSKIAQYHGMGSLEGWIKVVIHRLAIDRFRVQNKNVALEDLQAEPASTVKSRQADAAVQSLETQKALKMVSGSLTKALAKLTHKDKLVLKLYYLRNVSLKEIGRLLEVHESTASRLLDRLKTQLLKSVAKNLHDEFKVKKNEVAHVIELAQDHLELDLKEILAD